MIELRNVSKTYKSKKGSSTNALNNVSITFGEKGMTFILGKSGSGKSTLLNLLGGLDKYDSGEIIIFGKSSKNFTIADFDSYRNTYIGFVFQEFNILEDYDVYENVILALQLQQKELDQNKIDSLLEKLELKELKHRKVNELSGGQKQRVAIARALIKNPKVILADEPTGNLDSETGKDVMDLLKEISKEKLVIIVSHDRESANVYGDRIIEIKDGNVTSDTNDIKGLEANNRYKTIKSKLPMKESFKLGLGSLRHKKIKLFFTILLTICSLLFISVTDTLSNYNVNLGHSKLLKEQEEEFVQIEKYRFYSNDDFVNKDTLTLKEKDIKDIKNRVNEKGSYIYGVMNEHGYSYQNIYDVLHISSEASGYSYNYGSLALEIVEGSSYLDQVKLKGRKPNSMNEIVISNVVADIIMENGIVIDGNEELFKPKNHEEIIDENKTYLFADGAKVKIVGIIDYDISKYESVRKKIAEKISDLTNEEHRLFQNFSAKLNNVYNKIFVLDGFTKNLGLENNLPLNGNTHYKATSNEMNLVDEGMYTSPSLIHKELEYFNGEKWVKTKELKKNEVILNVKQLKNFDYTDYREKVNAYIDQNLGKNQLELEKDFFEEYIKKYDVIHKKISIHAQNSDDDRKGNKYEDLTVVGIVGLITDKQDYYYVSRELMGDYEIEITPITGIFILENKQSKFKKLMDEFPYNETISLKSTYSYDVNDMVRVIGVLKRISFYVSLVFVIFTVILIANFMFSSISYRKKEIGILRGLGARSNDVTKIFLWEGIILATIAFLISSIGLFVVTKLLNDFIMVGTNILLTPFIITVRQFVVILVLVYVIVFISSIIPIIKISKKKPIDAILNK